MDNWQMKFTVENHDVVCLRYH